MFRLLKLFTLTAIAYTIYHIIQETPQQPQPQRRRSHPQNLTGPAQGRRIQVATDEDTSHRATVGRGVVR
ncbi:MAG TPA: hypothetical protein VFE58_07140 [Tepidisphaeraceae bacterium]|jgi:hypothetical protein|nr:hypothetical protein [Tepidisphaeraceae bacterium]